MFWDVMSQTFLFTDKVIFVIYIIFAILIFILDFLSKRFMVAFLFGKGFLEVLGLSTTNFGKLIENRGGESFEIIKDVFNFTYIGNKGAAWGIFGGKQTFLIVVTAVLLAVIAIVAYKYRGKSKTLNTGLSFVTGGALGNLFDRIFYGKVVDFIDFEIIDFPIFNVADIFVCIGAGLVLIYFIFLEKEENGKN